MDRLKHDAFVNNVTPDNITCAKNTHHNSTSPLKLCAKSTTHHYHHYYQTPEDNTNDAAHTSDDDIISNSNASNNDNINNSFEIDNKLCNQSIHSLAPACNNNFDCETSSLLSLTDTPDFVVNAVCDTSDQYKSTFEEGCNYGYNQGIKDTHNAYH